MDALALALLHRLLAAPEGAPVAGLAAALGCPRDRLIAAIDQLRRAGCRIEDHPQRGVRLADSGLGCWADYLESRHAGGIGRRCLVYRRTASTQQAARQQLGGIGSADAAGVDGTVVLADHQSAGRGRLGRRWESAAGTQALLTAMVAAAGETTDRLMLAACHAVCEAVADSGRLAPRVRWPNDVMIGRRKLAGILIERVGGIALIGIGVNVSTDPAALAPPLDREATSLAREGATVDRLAFLDALLEAMDAAVAGASDAALQAAWRERSCLLEQRITVECGGRRLTGRVVDVDPREGLMLAVERGPIIRLPAATTSLVGMAEVS